MGAGLARDWPALHVKSNRVQGTLPQQSARCHFVQAVLHKGFQQTVEPGTRAHRALHVYVPLRYHLQPKGRDDKHTFGQPSRFLSAKVKRHFDETSIVHAI